MSSANTAATDSENPTVQIIGSITNIDAEKWNALTAGMPLLSHAFLAALETSGSVGKGTGWGPCTLMITQQDRLIGAMPLYIKSHSYGEYVFDWAWAGVYEKSGLAYYPKLLSAIPFSPITSTRLFANNNEIKLLLIEAIELVMGQHKLSSAHVLFPSDDDAKLFSQLGWMKRTGVQFRWENENYQTFESFLQNLSHNKRKKIHQERKKVAQANVTSRLIKGQDATVEDWDFFYQCYCITYDEHRSTPYLTRAFFSEISKSMPDNILLIMAEKNGKNIASTLSFYNEDTLYGRYWGATEFVSGLHFELCYYQAQQFCIDKKIKYFEGGAQGEHKLARGFKPRPTCSYHKIANPDFALAINDFLTREANGIAAYTTELEERVPFKAVE
ncbi:MAG: GNAT family N-acetyltransferase [Methylophilaceae bacterium]